MRKNVEVAVFDYSAIPPDIAAEARQAADRIRTAHRATVAAIVDIGKELIAIKARLDHGQFGLWLDLEFKMTARTAQNYMSAAEQFSGKSETISYLPPAMIYALAAPSTPQEVRDEVVQASADGKPVDPKHIRWKISEAIAEKEKAAAEAAEKARIESLPKGKRAKAEAAAKAKQEKKEAERKQSEITQAEHKREREAKMKALEDLYDLLMARLGDEFQTFMDLSEQADISWYNLKKYHAYRQRGELNERDVFTFF